jgi:hypothetical protein
MALSEVFGSGNKKGLQASYSRQGLILRAWGQVDYTVHVLSLKSIAYYARQCLGFLNPALDRIDARYFVDMFLLAVNCREFFVEMISSPLRQFFHRVYSGGSEKLSVLPADSLDSKEISFINPF